MKFHYVYEITNNINSKKYIGKRSCSCNIEQDQYMGSGLYLWNAINKYGINNFSKKILFICNSEEEAFLKEKELIDKVNATKNPMYYNIANGGHGGFVTKGYTKEQRIKMNSKISKAHTGKKLTKEQREKIRERTKGINNPMCGKRGINNPSYGRKHSEESKLKMSKQLKGRVLTEEHKKNISKSHADVSGDKNPRSVQAIVVIDNQTYIKNTRDEIITFIYENFGIKASKWFSRGVPNKYKHRVSLVKTIDKNKNEKIYYKSLQ